MNIRESKLTEEQRKELFKKLHSGIGYASNPSAVYPSIDIIESSLVELWEGGVTDHEIRQETCKRNLSRCYDAIQSAQGDYEQRDECGIDPEDAKKLRYLIAHLENPSYTFYLQVKKATEQALNDKIRIIRERHDRERAQAMERKLIPIKMDHPVINMSNIYKVFGLRGFSIDYENAESKTDAIFQFSCSQLSDDLRVLAERLTSTQIVYKQSNDSSKNCIIIKGEHVNSLRLLLEKLLPPAHDEIDQDQIKHPVFNKKNIKNKLNVTIKNVECYGNKELSITEKLTINFNAPYGEQLNTLTSFLDKNGIGYSHPLFADYLIISGEDINQFVKILGGSEIDFAKEFHRYRLPLPKNHKAVFDKENFKKVFALPSNPVFQIDYSKDFGLLNYVRIQFDKSSWESANEISLALKKYGVMHKKEYSVSYSTTIDILENSLSEFISLLTKDMVADLIINPILDEEKIQNKKNEIQEFSKTIDRFSSSLLFQKKSINITIKSISDRFGEKIASAVRKVDLSDYSLLNWVKIIFNSSESEEIYEFCHILKRNSITYDKSGPAKNIIFLESELACRSFEKLLFSSVQNEESQSRLEKSSKIASEVKPISNLTKENIIMAFDLENIHLLEENKEGEIRIIFNDKLNILSIKNLEIDLTSNGIINTYSENNSISTIFQKIRCITISSNSHAEFVKLVKEKCQEKLTRFLSSNPPKKTRIDDVD